MRPVVVKRSEIDPEPVEVIAKAILEIAEGMKVIRSTRLTQRAIALLIRDQTGIGMGDIFKVLNSLDTLEKDYLTKKP